MLVPVLIVITNGVVESACIYADPAALENAFVAEVESRGVSPVSHHFDDGFIELEDATICMSWAETVK